MNEKRVAIISGASKGLGRSTAYEFARSGINVCLLARSYKRLKVISSDISKKFKVNVLPIKVDITKGEEVKNAVNVALKELKRIDYLINFAGFPFDLNIWKKKIHELDEDVILKIYNVDFLGSFRLVKECIPIMMKQNFGVIVNISSIPTLSGDIEGAAYTFAKSSLISLTKNIARTYGIYNIRAYTVALGSIATPTTYNPLSKEERKKLAEETSLKRWGKPEEIAKLIYCLCSEGFSFVTGQTIIADGGVVIY
ncbi:MAG TPA: SDR family oxidoreductase [Geobacterales bacterium]|nr:SDR family oxidoreductase [Geobacterales bacterium]